MNATVEFMIDDAHDGCVMSLVKPTFVSYLTEDANDVIDVAADCAAIDAASGAVGVVEVGQGCVTLGTDWSVFGVE